MKNEWKWITLRLSYFAGGCFIGLLTYAPFTALLDWFSPKNEDFYIYSNSPLLKWVIFCGFICTLVTLNKKSIDDKQ